MHNYTPRLRHVGCNSFGIVCLSVRPSFRPSVSLSRMNGRNYAMAATIIEVQSGLSLICIHGRFIIEVQIYLRYINVPFKMEENEALFSLG